MPAPPKPTNGNLRTFGSPQSTGDLRDANPPINLNAGSLIGLGMMGAGGAAAIGLANSNRNDRFANTGKLAISNQMADAWMKANLGSRFGDIPELQWTIQDLFHPDVDRRYEAARHIESFGNTPQERQILTKAITAGNTWNNPSNNPDEKLARNILHKAATGESVIRGAQSRENLTTEAGRTRQDVNALAKWSAGARKGSDAPKPQPSTWTANPVVTRAEPELISNSERGRDIQAGRANTFNMRNANNAAWRQQTAQAFEQSPFARTMDAITSPVRKISGFMDRFVPEPIRGTWKGGALKAGVSTAAGMGAAKLGYDAASNFGRNEAAAVKAADVAAGQGMGPAVDAPAAQAAKQKAAMNKDVTDALATLKQYDEGRGVDKYTIEQVEKHHNLPAGTLSKFITNK